MARGYFVGGVVKSCQIQYKGLTLPGFIDRWPLVWFFGWHGHPSPVSFSTLCHPEKSREEHLDSQYVPPRNSWPSASQCIPLYKEPGIRNRSNWFYSN